MGNTRRSILPLRACSCALLQRFDDLARFGIDQRLIVNEGRRSKVRGIRLDRFRHARHGVPLLGGQHTLEREYRLGECDAGCVGGLLQRDLRDHLVQLAPAGKLALHIVREGLERPGRQGKRDGEQFSFAQDVEHTLVLAQLALTLAAAELVIRAVLAVPAGIPDARHAVKAAAVGRIVAARVLVAVVCIGGMVIDDNAGDVLRHFGLIALRGRNLESRAAACGQLHAVEGKLKPLAIVRHSLVQYVSVRRVATKPSFTAISVFFLSDMVNVLLMK